MNFDPGMIPDDCPSTFEAVSSWMLETLAYMANGQTYKQDQPNPAIGSDGFQKLVDANKFIAADGTTRSWYQASIPIKSDYVGSAYNSIWAATEELIDGNPPAAFVNPAFPLT